MLAIVADQYGPPDQLRLAEVPRPEPGPGQVLVAVHASGVHADVWHMVRGVPYALRLMGAGLRRPANPIPGTDMAGVVTSLGPGASRFQPGDQVFGEVVTGMQWRNGGAYAQYVAVDEAALETIPEGVSFVAAAAVPTSGMIALTAVTQDARVRAGHRVLVNGAAGGVGQFVVQIARAQGAHVTGVERPDRLDLLSEVGVDEVLDGVATDYTQVADRFDAIIDIPGNRPFSHAQRVLTETGRYVLIGHDHYGASGHRWVGSIPRALGLMARGVVNSHAPRPAFTSPPSEGMSTLAALLSSGQLHPVIGATFPLERTAEAVALLESGRARGKVALTVVSPES